MSDQTASPWVTADQLADHLQVNRRSIERYVELGMPSLKLRRGHGGARRFNVAEVEQWLRDQPQEQPA